MLGNALPLFFGFGFAEVDQCLPQSEHRIDDLARHDSRNRSLTGDDAIIFQRLNYLWLGESSFDQLVCCLMRCHFSLECLGDLR
jgi:hypothetical protein